MTQETKHEKFLRLAPPRVEKALHAISLISNFGSPAYETRTEEVSSILDALNKAVSDVSEALGAGSGESAPETMTTPTREDRIHSMGPDLDLILNDLTDGNIEAARARLIQLLGS